MDALRVAARAAAERPAAVAPAAARRWAATRFTHELKERVVDHLLRVDMAYFDQAPWLRGEGPAADAEACGPTRTLAQLAVRAAVAARAVRAGGPHARLFAAALLWVGLWRQRSVDDADARDDAPPAAAGGWGTEDVERAGGRRIWGSAPFNERRRHRRRAEWTPLPARVVNPLRTQLL
eukprot:gene28352-34638_t